MPDIDRNKLRDRAVHSISPDCADAAGITFQQLRGFISGCYQLTDAEATKLARWPRLEVIITS